MTDLAHYYFVPTVREGLAACIAGPPNGSRVSVPALLTPMADEVDGPSIAKFVGLYGPGDVVGFDASIVVRTDPRPNVGDYEPNFMPIIEFSEPDFPWRFTPNVALDDNGRLDPWLTLIVLRSSGPDPEFAGVRVVKPTPNAKGTLPVRWIEGAKLSALPDLSYAWMWAHVQVTAEADLPPEAIRDRVAGVEGDDVDNNAISRLICPRRLAPRMQYSAFVVPTFKLGQVAAGLVPSLADSEDALTPGWVRGTSDSDTINLPYYYTWDFATGDRGDFEHLVRLLQPRELTALGTRRLDCASLEYDLPDVERTDNPPPGDQHVLDLEGALKSPELDVSHWGADQDPTTPNELQTQLAELVNSASLRINEVTSDETSATRPLVTPPIYGRWHAGRPSVDPHTGNAWLNRVNLDPRHRTAAGFGVLVVEKQQEPLMASLWDQLGDIDIANDLIRRGQLGLEASKGVFERFRLLSDAEFLSLTAPIFRRTRIAPPSTAPVTVSDYLAGSPIPRAAFDPAFRRLLRRRGGLRKRQRTVPPTGKAHILWRLNDGTLAAAGPPPKLVGMPSMCDVTDAALATLREATKKNGGKAPEPHAPRGTIREPRPEAPLRGAKTDAPPPGGPSRANDFCEEAITCEAVYEATSTARGRQRLHRATAETICRALLAWLGPETPPPAKPPVDLGKVRDVVEKALDPRLTIPARVSARLHLGPGIHQKPNLGLLESEVEFPQPMYEPLRDISQDLILPGVDTVPQNTISIVETNRRFVEAYMLGLNHAFSGESLWRGAPVYLWTTFFRQFWDVRGCIDPETDDTDIWKDIMRMTTWDAGSDLGSHDPRSANAPERAVLLIRGELLKRYPNTLVYAVESQADNNPALEEYGVEGQRLWPIFSGSLPPDLNFFGFDKTPADLCKRGTHGKGYFIVLEERLSEPRFGFDIPADETHEPPSVAKWFDLTWAHIAPAVFEGFPENSYIDDRTAAVTDPSAPAWGASAATMASICLQRPVRIAIHASKMLSEQACQ